MQMRTSARGTAVRALLFLGLATDMTPIPGLGILEIALLPEPVVLPLQAMGQNGLQITCGLPCRGMITPVTVYAQVITFDPVAFEFAGITNLATIVETPVPTADCDGDNVSDTCETDCDGDGRPDDCELLDGTATDLNGNSILDECECLDAPEDLCDAGRFRLYDSPNGTEAPPSYGFRFDDLLGSGEYTFSFSQPGAEMFLDYDEVQDSIRIHGLAYGGKDVGSDWDPVVRGFLEIDVRFSDVKNPQCKKMKVHDTASQAGGKLRWLNTGEELDVLAMANADGLFFEFDGKDGAGWLQLADGSSHGCCHDFIFRGKAEAICP